jgi:antitoxin YefM
MTTTTIRELRANMKTYFDSLEDNKEILLVPRQGNKEAIVIMTLSEYNSITETEYLLSTKSNRKVIEKALKELDNEEVTEFKIQE